MTASREDRERIDSLIGELIDGDRADGRGIEGIPGAAERAGDMLLLDALLARVHHPDAEAEARERRVQRAMSGIRGERAIRHPGSAHVHRAARWMRTTGVRWAMAAGLLLAISILWIGPSKRSAASALDMAIEAASLDQDRTFDVTIEHARRDGSKRAKEATLFLRGGNRFVLRVESQCGADFVVGSNGEQLWVVADGELVQVHDRGAQVEPWLQIWDLTSSFFDVRTALVELRERYDVELVSASGRNITHIRGRLRDDSRNPDHVEAWVGSDGVVERLLFAWEPERGRRSVPSRMEFNLRHRDPMPDSLYEHASHHP